MFNRCLHDWKILDKTVLDSPYEQTVKAKIVLNKVEGTNARQLFQKVSQTIVICTKCGKKEVHTIKLFEEQSEI